MAKPKTGTKMFEEPQASLLEGERQKARRNRRIIYDCFNARVDEDYQVRCRKGYAFGEWRGGSVNLLGVLRGRTPSVCQKCPDYDDGGEPGD